MGQHWKFAKEHWKALFPGGSARAEPGPRMEGILRVRTDLACLLYTPASTLRPDVLLRDVWQSLADATGEHVTSLSLPQTTTQVPLPLLAPPGCASGHVLPCSKRRSFMGLAVSPERHA